jgi:hypothetical protein
LGRKISHEEKQRRRLNKHGILIRDKREGRSRSESKSRLQSDRVMENTGGLLLIWKKIRNNIYQKTISIAVLIKNITRQIKTAVWGLVTKT